ncbi:TM2 domain-containing protein [Deinococcus aerophilus]|nr:NINE protein [Deinococcus aerophilus]
MTNPDGKPSPNGTGSDPAGPEPTPTTREPGTTRSRTPQGNAPSWVDEVLGTPARGTADRDPPAFSGSPRPDLSKSPAGSDDLRIPGHGPAQDRPSPSRPPTAPPRSDGWATGATAEADSSGPARGFGSWGDPQRQPVPSPQVTGPDFGDVAQKRLVAGLLAIVLGSLGIHKFYLGLNTQGAIILGTNIGVWVLALLLGVVTLGLGLIITVPLAGLISTALGVLGLIEGVLYLTKSDADFEREYLAGHKPWL